MKKILYSLLLLMPTLVLAQPTTLPTTLSGGGDDVIALIDTLTGWIFTVFLALAVIMIVIAAYRYLTSSGDPAKVASANKMLIFAVVGIAVAFLANGIVFVVKQLVIVT